MTLYDISRSISPDTVVWEGDPLPGVQRVQSLDSGDSYNLTRLDISAHTATHVDAPLHFIPGGAAVDSLPLDVLAGPAWVAAIPVNRDITAADLEAAAIPPGVTRLLLKTGSDPEVRPPGAPGGFQTRFAGLALDAAEWCIRRGVRLVGIDTISIEGYDSIMDGSRVHVALLGAGVVIVENLELSAVPPGVYRLMCLPLKIAGADGAPARAILESEES